MCKVAFFDIDGTLLVDGETAVRPQVVQAIESLQVEKMIATGRNYAQAKEFIDLVNPKSYICSNGQYVVYKNEVVHQHFMQREQVDAIINFLKTNDVHWAYETSKRIYLAEGQSAAEIRQMIQGYGIVDVVVSEDHLDDGVFQMWAFGSKEQMDDIEGYLSENYNAIRWGENSIEVVCDNQNKGNAIKILLKHIGLDTTSYAFGDGLNDLEMLSTVDFGVAMGNARQPVKDCADFVTTNCDELGLIKGLELVGLK